ncbi:MAG: hypothetical protein ACE5HA_18815, partial [Anaerolineae bacterium]
CVAYYEPPLRLRCVAYYELMDYEDQARIAILKLLGWFGVLFVLLPRWLFPRPDVAGGGVRFFANLARMVLATAIIVQGLVLLHLFDFFSLVISYLILGVGIASWHRRRLPIAELNRAVTLLEASMIDALEGNLPYRLWLTGYWRRIERQLLARQPDRAAVAWGIVLGVVLLISAGLRLAGVPARAAPGDPGSYLHMTWTRLLASKVIWPNGAFPMGADSWVQTIAQFARVDTSVLIRATGGLVGLLMTVAVYVTVRWAGGRHGPAVVATAMYGIFIFSGVLPAGAWRQQELHPFEFGLVFLLPSLMFFAGFLDSGRRALLWLAGECLASAFILHPVSGLFGLLGLLAVSVVRLVSRPLAARWIGRAVAAGAMAVLAGNLFLLLAVLLGRPRHQGVLDMVPAFLSPATPGLEWRSLMLALAALGAGLVLSPAEDRALFRRSVGLFLWLLVALFMGYPTMLSSDKVGIPLSLVAAAGLGLELDILLGAGLALARRLGGKVGAARLHPSIGLTAGLVALAIAGMTVISPPLRADPGLPSEPESFARTLYRIKDEHLAYTWTVVGYPEVLPQVLGRGYYFPWGVFLEKYDPVQYRFDPRNPDLAIPTRYVFIMVEKQVFVGPYDLAADTLQRAKYQVALQDWVARYQEHHDDMSVYYEDGSVAVYQIYRSPETEQQIIEEYEAEQFERR